jgi:hypothetical protein
MVTERFNQELDRRQPLLSVDHFPSLDLATWGF